MLKVFYKPTGGRWCKYREMILGILKKLNDLDIKGCDEAGQK